ncbi:TPA: ATP-dependent endonuclease [Bacillus cereus]
MGEGLVSLFCIIDALYDSKPGSTIIIDEPELSLHPSLLRRLAQVFKEESKDKQIVISTHSPYFIDFSAIEVGVNIVRVYLENEESRVAQLSDEFRKKIKGLRNNLYNPHILGLDAKEVFFLEDCIILVEGQDDVIYYPKIAQELQINIEGNFFGWGVGGASNMSIISRILKDLGYKKVIGILDNDKPAEKEELENEFTDYKYFVIPAKDVRTKEATKAREQVEGLLDDKNKAIRPEYKGDATNILNDINQYLNLDTIQ